MKILKKCHIYWKYETGLINTIKEELSPLLKYKLTHRNKPLHCLHIHFMAENHNLMCLLTMTVLHVIFQNIMVKMTYI
jgi:hypothetical protein